MHSALFKTIKITVFASLCTLGAGVSSVAASDETVTWELSLWGGPRAVTYPVEDWAEAMKERTNGKWNIEVHYGATLGNPKDQLDNLSSGLFEAAAINPFYSPGQLPLVQVMDLPFIMPQDYGDIIDLAWDMFHQPAINKEIESWNVVPLLPGMTPQYEYMGREKIETASDFEGVKISGMSADMGRAFQSFGAIPTPMPAPELYSSLERGTIDGVIYCYTYAMGSYKLYEVSPYVTTGIGAGSPVFTFMANKDAWEDLPEEFRKIHLDYIENDYKENALMHISEADKHFESEFEKAGIEFNTLPESERDKLVTGSKDIWNAWADQWSDRGPTEEILNTLIKKRRNLENN